MYMHVKLPPITDKNKESKILFHKFLASLCKDDAINFVSSELLIDKNSTWLIYIYFNLKPDLLE
jgi:hypothetical protein